MESQPVLKSDAQAVIDTVERLAPAEVRTLEGEQYIVLPRDKRVESLKPIIDAFRVKPERRRGTITASW